MGRFSDEYVYKLREENATLIAELDELRYSIFGRDSRAMVSSIRRAIGTTHAQSSIILGLLSKPLLTYDEISSFMPPADSGGLVTTSRNHVCKIRRHMKKYGVEIKTVFGKGYTIDSKDKERLLAIVGE